jgi:hypothetical protein
MSRLNERIRSYLNHENWKEWVWLEVSARIYMSHTTVASHSPSVMKTEIDTVLSATGIDQTLDSKGVTCLRGIIRRICDILFIYRV